ncbi:hypothetical protein [Gemmata sp.]|uniref:hypothetical protein n=1 Tax=Gemmata sp. TaxID=1914242 RepID=UPI003F6F068F
MTANPPPAPDRPADDDAYDTEAIAAEWGEFAYPGIGSREDVLARIEILEWITTQLGKNGIDPAVGDYVLATDGRILGYGPDPEEVHRRVFEAEPDLKRARLVAISIPPLEW